MTKKPSRIALAVGLKITAASFSQFAHADFLADGNGKLEWKNFYFSRDFRDGFPSQSKREEWAQGMELNLKSGFTPGPIGFGLDTIAMLGIKLDSSPDRSGTGLLPRDLNNQAADDYSKVLATAKAKLGDTELRYGGLSPQWPLLASNGSRLFPQYFTGGQIVSKSLDHFVFHLGQVDRVKQRDSTDSEELTTMTQLGVYSGRVQSHRYTYGGVDYEPVKNLTLSVHMSELEDFYQRTYLGFKYSRDLGPGKAFTEIRYFGAQDTGAKLIGKVDNKVISSNFGYQLGAHRLSGGYQEVAGDTAYVYLGGTDTYLFSEQQAYTFTLENEVAWHARYDYDFAELGIPGLTLTFRYVKGEDVNPNNIATGKATVLRREGREGQEWERTTDLTYVVRRGPLKNFSIRWRNATARSTVQDGVDENRLILSYAINF